MGSREDTDAEKVAVIKRLRELAERLEQLDVDVDPPAAWLPRESQERLRDAVREFKATLREILPAESKARKLLGDDDLN